MLATAIALQDVTKEAVHDESCMELASALFHMRNTLEDEDFMKALYMYSAHLASLTTTLVTTTLLTENEINEMMNTIKEMESLGKDITNGNN
jgi:predicted membrane-bound spermidine synthase